MRYPRPLFSTQIAITDVAVVDVVRGAVLPAQTILLEGPRIVAVGPASRVRPASDARLVDGRGRWAIPGLWDMHAHIDDTGGAGPSLGSG